MLKAIHQQQVLFRYFDEGNFSTHHIRRQTLADSNIGIGNSAPLVD